MKHAIGTGTKLQQLKRLVQVAGKEDSHTGEAFQIYVLNLYQKSQPIVILSFTPTFGFLWVTVQLVIRVNLK